MRFPRREPTQITMAATTSAAIGSAFRSQVMPVYWPIQTAAMPRITTNVLHTSVEK